MSTDEHVVADAGTPASGGLRRRRGPRPDQRPHLHAGPNWWHRDHPVFTPLSGFFAGLLIVIVVPGTFGALLSAMFDNDTAEHLFPYVTVILGIPLVLIAVPRTRRFGGYLLLGMITTAIVVIGVAALTLWVLVSRDS